MPWSVTVDREKCMGTGSCMVYAGDTIVYDVEGKATINEPITDDLDAVQAAIEACPTQALAIVGETS
ncbi:MAG: ferredoxin [Actinomycetota bacterium]